MDSKIFCDNEFLKQFIETISEMIPITVRGADGKFIFTSKQFRDRLNLSEEDLVNKSSTELIAKKLYGVSSSEIAFETGEDASAFFPSADGDWVYSRSQVVRDKAGKIKYVITWCMLPVEVQDEIRELQSKLARFEHENANIREYLFRDGKQMVFSSEEMEGLVGQAEKAAKTDASILLTGESGVGKDVLAQYIHTNSARKDKPFVPICIPQFSKTLIESELFGYEKGAFTGSSNTGHVGLLETANGGTVFFDEVGDIAPELQVKLLRVLENQEFTRVGGNKPIKIDVRFVLATNRNLKQMVLDRTFREDLFYRINVIHLNIKPLRERRGDIVPLAQHFLRKIDSTYGLCHDFSDDVLRCFLQYRWPGNVRELRNLVEKLVVLSDHKQITLETLRMLKQNGYLGEEQAEIQEAADAFLNNNLNNLQERYSAMENQKILDALMQTNGNRTEAAKLLNISRSTLYRRLLKKHNTS